MKCSKNIIKNEEPMFHESQRINEGRTSVVFWWDSYTVGVGAIYYSSADIWDPIPYIESLCLALIQGKVLIYNVFSPSLEDLFFSE